MAAPFSRASQSKRRASIRSPDDRVPRGQLGSTVAVAVAVALADDRGPGAPTPPGTVAWVIRLAAWAIRGIWRGSSRRPGSETPWTHVVRTKASTTAGSNWMPAHLREFRIRQLAGLVQNCVRHADLADVVQKS
jgi:hypothetical protein